VAILAALFRARIYVLAILALGTAAAAWFAFRGHAVPVGALFLSALSVALGVCLAFAHLRHAGLALIAALSPLPGMIAASLPATGLSYSEILSLYGFATVAAACLAGDLVGLVLKERAPADAARLALARALLPLALGVLTPAALLAGLLFKTAATTGASAAGELAAATVSILLFVPFGAAVVPYGETFFVRANRARERRERLLRLLAEVVEPRWGLSLAGSALVLAVLGWFGAWPLLARGVSPAQAAMAAAALLAALLSAHTIGRDWREAVAATLTLAELALMSLWLWGRAIGHLRDVAFVEIAVASGAALLAMLLLLARSRSYRRAGDAPAVARRRALEELGLAPYFGAAGAAAAIAPWLILHGSLAPLAILFLLAGLAAGLGMPAIATALGALVPRRRSLNQLYGRG